VITVDELPTGDDVEEKEEEEKDDEDDEAPEKEMEWLRCSSLVCWR